MKRTIILATLIFIFTSWAMAQQSTNSTNEWSGFYVGGNGFASSDKTTARAPCTTRIQSLSFCNANPDNGLQINQISGLFLTGRGIVIVPGTDRPFNASRRKTNWGGGGQAGYLWQAGKFVFGAEGDFNPFPRTFSVSSSQVLALTALQPLVAINARRDVRISREFSIRARGGVAFGKTLVYGTGGYSNAQARVSSIDSFTNPGGRAAAAISNGGFICHDGLFDCTFNSGPEGPVVTTANETKNMNGWNVGGGIERKFGKHLSIGFEYRHTNLGSKTFTLSNQTTVNTGPETIGDKGDKGQLGSVSTGPTIISLKSDSFGVRINYHFASSAMAQQSTNSKPSDWRGFYVGGNGFRSSENMGARTPCLSTLPPSVCNTFPDTGLQITQISGLFLTGRGIITVPVTSLPFNASQRKTNWGGGGQAGYLWQVGRFVFGTEGDFNPSHRTFSVSQSQPVFQTGLTPIVTVKAQRDVRISREFSIRARGGVAFGKTLVYATGGYSTAQARVSSIDSFTNPGGPNNCFVPPSGGCTSNLGPEGPVVTTASESRNIDGWNAGSGIEQKFGKHPALVLSIAAPISAQRLSRSATRQR